MAFTSIALTVPQYVDLNGDVASGFVLKASEAGTTTLLQMATDSTGGTLVNDIVLNSSGYPAVSGNIIIPHIDANFKLHLYPTQAAADANSGATWTIDNLTPTGISTTIVETITTLTNLRNYTGIATQITLQGGAAAGDGAGSLYRFVSGSPASTFTDDGFATIVPTGGDGSAAWLSIPTKWPDLITSATLTVGTTLTMSGGAINQLKGADIAAAATTDIGAATGNFVDITIATGAVSATVAAGGTGYTVNDKITLSGGTSTAPAIFNVDTVSAGVVTAVSVAASGAYTVEPGNPVSTTGGTGSGCTLTVTFSTAITAASATVAAGGTGYTVGDDITLSGGTFVTAAVFNVDTVSGGVVLTVSVVTAGNYTTKPSDPVSTTGGTGGDDCTLNVVFNNIAITSLGTIQAGVQRKTRTPGIVDFTRNATSLILLGETDYTAEVDDQQDWMSLGSGNWLMTGVKRIADNPLGIVTRPEIATTSGTDHDFTDIPSYVSRITVMLDVVSASGTDLLQVVLGDSGGFETSGYVDVVTDGTTTVTSTAAFTLIPSSTAASETTGALVLTRANSSNKWVATHLFSRILGGADFVAQGAGSKTLSGTLTQIRLTLSGSDTTDAGTFGLAYS